MLKISRRIVMKQLLSYVFCLFFGFGEETVEAYPEIETEEEILEKIDNEFDAILDKIEESKEEIALQRKANDEAAQNSRNSRGSFQNQMSARNGDRNGPRNNNHQNNNYQNNGYQNNEDEEEERRRNEELDDLEYQLNDEMTAFKRNIESMRRELGINENYYRYNEPKSRRSSTMRSGTYRRNSSTNSGRRNSSMTKNSYRQHF